MKIESMNLNLNFYDSKQDIKSPPKEKTNEIIKTSDNSDKFTIPKTNFSYDSGTDTLVVKVKTGNVLHQFPSDDLLRMKKFLMENNS